METSFEAIDAKISKADLTPFREGGAKYFSDAEAAAAPGDVLSKVCSIYHVVKPILSGVVLIPFIPAKWKDAIKTFMTLMDQLCPAT